MERPLTNISYIKDLCDRYGFRFDKKFGQNFIINPSVCPRMVDYSGMDENSGVIEIGTGFGTLTRELSRAARKVVAIEIDTSLQELLKETLADCGNVKIIFDDVLNVDLKQLIEDEFGGMDVYVCANLPYYITSPIIMKLLEEELPIKAITVMVQKEAAQRLCALPGSRDAGAISLAVQYYSTPSVCFSVSPGSFYPPPKVTSSVIRLDIGKKDSVAPQEPAAMFRLIRAAFSQRRKTFSNSVSNNLGLDRSAVEDALTCLGIDVKIRPEKLTLEDFSRLSDILMS